jgi:hypothetical protein
MIDIDELWIGDIVFVKSLDENAIWEGKIDINQAKVKHNNEIHNVPITEISEAKEILEAVDFEFKEEVTRSIDPLQFPNSIDLHIEKLNNDLSHQTPELIVNYQMRVCNNYIKQAISCNKSNFTIIHGVGKGVLKKEVIHALGNFNEYHYHVEKNEGGAIEVWMKY